MSRDDILREIADDEELASLAGGGGSKYDSFKGVWYKTSQWVQCTGLKDCGGCDKSSGFGKYLEDSKPKRKTSIGLHC